MAGKIIDAALTYALLKRLVTPFNKWPAFKLGIIDAEGKVLRPRKTLDAKEKESWGRFDILAANIKKIIQRVPGGKTHIASIAAAAYLFKEGIDISNQQSLEKSLFNYLKEDGLPVAGDTGSVANIVGGGRIAGVGIGPQGEPPVRRAPRLARIKSMMKKKNDMTSTSLTNKPTGT
jgi:hypothetical protein